jgi:hypothetical protein
MTEEWFLGSVSRCQWTVARQELTADWWYWADLSGAHLESTPPEESPLTTHLWGWGRDRWIRLRVDGDEVLGAELSLDVPVAGGGTPASVRRVLTRSWAEGETRVNVASVLRSRDMLLLEVTAPVPLTFMELS